MEKASRKCEVFGKVYARKLRNLRVGSCIVSGQVYINERCSRQKIEVAVPEYKEVGN